MSGWQAVLLGIIQGLTEFLPVSSSGHLVLAKAMLGIEQHGIAFEIFVHFGTFLAVAAVFRHDIRKLFDDLRWLLRLPFRKKESTAENADASQRSNLLLLLIIGNIPAVVLGLVFRDTFERTFANPTFVSAALIVTAIILISSRLAKESSRQLNVNKSIIIGLAQAGALFPGISRSGTTISAGLVLGIRPVESARFSFLLTLPLILGVTILKTFELVADPPSNSQIAYLMVGCVSAFVSGFVAIKWLMGIMQKGRFDRFGYYCLGVGTLGLIVYNF